ALGVMALAARAADREQQRRGSGSPGPLTGVSPVGLHVPTERRHEMQSTTASRSISTMWLVALVVAAGMAVRCARSPGVPAGPAGTDGSVRSHHLREDTAPSDDSADEADYDPWQSFNERMFSFNHDILDGWLVKPAAKGWAKIFPEVARRSFSRMINNLDMPRRLVNNLLQARPLGAGRELARFAVNSTAGVGGLIGVASLMHVEPSEADSGETLALYGIHPGPYLVLPTMPPLTVRDAIGRGIDGALDPVSYVLPFIGNQAKSIVTAVNERSLNLKLFADVEDSVLDLYSAARNGYLQRRRKANALAAQDRDEEGGWLRKPPAVEQPQPASSENRENPS